jgi:hypothetical protein
LIIDVEIGGGRKNETGYGIEVKIRGVIGDKVGGNR